MKKRFLGLFGFFLLLYGCTQGTINDLPFYIILIPATVAVVIVAILLALILKVQKNFFTSSKRTMKKNLASELSRAKRFNYKTGLLILDVKTAVPRGVHNFLPGRTIDVESLQSKLREYDQVIKMNFRRYKVILSQIAADEDSETIKKRLLATAAEMKWGEIRIGVASYPKDGETAEELIKAAEKDMKE
ncbi:MAG: hypothetical protein A2149_02160 [Candidatus Schekmanbacteria bacterium RBG_16_38_11]|uniref:GGDEF domain-containing protein n=2 Tax=Candidatus Schekmaniibacteriota TaxID=1817811 RepID=A0A1F7RDH2_9BACT|nr:MAG: hypothetical protein A2042_08300 [Candidatus Schekmanbacteria bacterium GWA2_38_11]OGL45778.1 MAG: hypothetical protein A2149_02160 [Candidatus Schekmanbacteria bacterium RBG_16_38_11]